MWWGRRTKTTTIKAQEMDSRQKTRLIWSFWNYPGFGGEELTIFRGMCGGFPSENVHFAAKNARIGIFWDF